MFCTFALEMQGIHEAFISRFLECGGVVEGTSGVIQSPGYPNGYAHWIRCYWNIIAPFGRKVKLEFDDLDMERPSRGTNQCRYDTLTVSVASS